MEFSQIEMKVEERICTITLNRPDIRNAFVEEMRNEIRAALQLVKTDDNVKAIILTGSGPSFCAGGDLSDMQRSGVAAGRKQLQEGQKLINECMRLEKPIIVALNGAAAGAGMSLALCCDVIIASESAYFAPGFINIGLVPDLGLIQFLSRLIGRHRTLEVLLSGDRLPIGKAYELGIINRVVKDENLLHEAEILARKFANGPGLAIGYTKKLVNRTLHDELERTFELEELVQGYCFESDDFKEGVDAFFGKRQPEFK